MSGKKSSKFQLPERMKAVRQQNPGGALGVETIPVPHPGPGEVLIKMIASPINPSDLATIRGDYLNHSYPYTPGLEGSGEVIRSGGGLLAGMRMGKLVACSPNPQEDGTWAEYMKTSAMRVAPVPANIGAEQGSMMLVNPMTALAFINLARKDGHRAIVNTAAASSLGKMLIRLCNHYQLPLINIVRKEEHVEELKELGGVHILNSTDESFGTDLQKLAAELNATLFLDAVTGRQTSLLLKSAPRGSTLLAYARLSGDPIQVDPASLIKEEKVVAGFQLGNWLNYKNILFKLRHSSKVSKLMSTLLTSSIRSKMSLEQIEEAVKLYSESMSSGKILIMPGHKQVDLKK